MTIRFLRLCCAMIAAGTVCAVALPALNPAWGVVFAGEKARELARQCSRNVPAHVTGTWTPDAGQIAELEKGLPAALAKTDSQNDFHSRDVSHLARQYGGLVVSLHKLIYVNGFSTVAFNNDWRKNAAIVCDGGPAFWGVEYDPAAKTFSNFAFNGVA